MTLRIALVSLLALSATAAAAPEKTKADGPGELIKKCDAKGTPLFQKEHQSKAAKAKNEIWRIYESGAVTTQIEKEKESEPTCLKGPQLEDAKAQIKKSPWKITTARVHCMMVSDELTIYQVEGKEVFREVVCSGKSLDDVSAKTLETLNGLVTK